jgi:hypothetical protein
MNLTRKYSLVGAMWGVILGYGAVAIATGLGVALLWLLYRDGPWGDNTATILYSLGLFALVGSIVFCTVAGYTYGRRAAGLANAEQASEHRRAHVLIGSALLAAVLGGYTLHAQNSALMYRQAWLDQLLAQRHVISALQVRERADYQGLDVSVDARGEREGRYMLELQILDGSGNAVHEQREAVDAPAHDLHRIVSVEYSDVLQRGLEHGGRGQAAVAQRDMLTVLVRLTPILDRRELRGLPDHIAMHYQSPESEFHSERSQAVYLGSRQ